jgi:hypothetical protein
VGRYVDWTVTAIDEGNAPQSKRNGVATQLWLIRSLNQKMELGMGAAVLQRQVPDGPGALAQGRAGERGRRYHLSKRVVGVLNWGRVVTDYHRDTDLLMLGLGYSFWLGSSAIGT